MSLFKNEEIMAVGNYSISKLIANDIIGYGLDYTSSNHSLVYLDSLMEEYNEEAQQYVKEHLDEIIQDVRGHSTVSEETKIYYDEEGKLTFDFSFVDEKIFDPIQKEISKIVEAKGTDLDFDEIKSISQEVMDSDEYKDLLDGYVEEKLDMGKEL